MPAIDYGLISRIAPNVQISGGGGDDGGGDGYVPGHSFFDVSSGTMKYDKGYQPKPAAQAQGSDLDKLTQNIVQSDYNDVVGTEFGEVDRPGRPGAYPDKNWNIGKWGHSLEGYDNEGIALPGSILKNYGDYNKPDFANNFNSQFDIVVRHPDTGTETVAPLKDYGPAGWTGAGLDLLGGTRTKLGLGENFKGHLQYKIVPKGTYAGIDTQAVGGGGGQSPEDQALGRLSAWDFVNQQLQHSPQTVSVGTLVQANDQKQAGQPGAVIIPGAAAGTIASLWGATPEALVPAFTKPTEVRQETRPEFFGMRVATDEDVAKYDQYVQNGNDPKLIDPYDRLAIALRKDPKFLTNPQNVGVLQEMVLDPIEQQKSRQSTNERVTNAIVAGAQGIWGAVGDVGNYLKSEAMDAVPSLRYVAAKALGMVPDQDSQNAFARQAALHAVGVAKLVTDTNALLGSVVVGTQKLDTNIGLMFTSDPQKRAELKQQYAIVAQDNARWQDSLFDLGQHLQGVTAQMYSWLPGTADIAHKIATQQIDPSAAEGFSVLAQFAIPEGAGLAAKSAIQIFKPTMVEHVLDGIIDSTTTNSVKVAYQRAGAVPRDAAQEAANPFYQAGRTAQSNIAADGRAAAQTAQNAADALAEKLTSFQKQAGDPGAVSQFVGSVAMKAGDMVQQAGELAASAAKVTDGWLNKISGNNPVLRKLLDKAIHVILFATGAHEGHALWGRLFESVADVAGEAEHVPALASKISDALKTYGREKLYGENTIPFWTRFSEGTKLIPPQLASMLDSPAIQSIGSITKGAAAGTLAGIPIGALSDPDDPIQGAASMSMLGGVLGMAGGGFSQWLKYKTPGDFYKAMRADWKRTSDMLSSADKQTFLGLKARDQLMIGTFAQQHPGLKLNFFNDPKGSVGLHYSDPITGKPTVSLNIANPESTMRMLWAHETTHAIQDSGMLPEVYDTLLGNPDRGTIGQYTLLGADGKPVGLDANTGRYITNQDFTNFKNQYKNGLERAGVPTSSISDLRIAQELYAEHAADYMMSTKGYVDGISAYRPGWRNSNALKKSLANLGMAFDENGGIVQGTGLFDGVVRNDELDRITSQYLRKRASERKYGGAEEDATRRFTQEDMRKTNAAETFLDTAPEIRRNPDGTVMRDANTGLPIYRTQKEVAQYNAKLANEIFDRIAAMPEDQRTAMGVRIKGDNMFVRYMPNDLLEGLAKNNEYNANQVGMLRGMNEMLADNSRMGTNVRFFYHKALTEGKRYRGFEGSEKFTVPYGLEVTRNDNVNIRGVDFQQLTDNYIHQAKRAPYKDLWKDPSEFTQDVHTYFENHAEGRRGDENGIGPAKRDAINALANFGTELHAESNPLVEALPKRGVRPIVKSYRIDRANQFSILEKTNPFTDEGQYRKMNMNYRPRRGQAVAEEEPALGPETIPVTMRTTKSGKEVPQTFGYDIANAPLVADKQPGELAKDSPNQFGHVDFLGKTDQQRLTALDKASATSAYSTKLVKEYGKWKDNPDVMAAKDWYTDVRAPLEEAFGDDAEKFAHLLSVTSPQQGVVQNWKDALEAYQRYKQGHYDDAIAQYKETGKITPDMQPRKANGALYGINSDNVLKALAGTWIDEVKGPKTPNFFANLFGRGQEATIDKWAGRTMRRLGHEGIKGAPEQWRLTPPSEKGVSDLDFAFSQQAFRKAADKLGMDPHELQAIMWYAEKHHWAEQGWSKGGAAAAKASYIPQLREYAAQVTAAGGPETFARAGFKAFASGGIVTEPTLALIGEKGPEAVVPLSTSPEGSPASWASPSGVKGRAFNFPDETFTSASAESGEDSQRDTRPTLPVALYKELSKEWDKLHEDPTPTERKVALWGLINSLLPSAGRAAPPYGPYILPEVSEGGTLAALGVLPVELHKAYGILGETGAEPQGMYNLGIRSPGERKSNKSGP